MVLEVVIAIRQARSALVGFGDYFGGILGVLIGTESKERAAAEDRSRVLAGSEIFGYRLLRLESLDTFQFGSKRRRVELFDRGLVHAGGVVVADLFRDRVFLSTRLRGF